MVGIITYKLRSATLVETIVALSISLVIFGITLSIFLQVNTSGTSMQKLKAKSLLDAYILNTQTNREYFDEEREAKGLLILREVFTWEGNGGATKVKFSISTREGKKLAIEWRIFKS